MEPAKSGRTLIDTEPRVTEYPKNEREKLFWMVWPFLLAMPTQAFAQYKNASFGFDARMASC